MKTMTTPTNKELKSTVKKVDNLNKMSDYGDTHIMLYHNEMTKLYKETEDMPYAHRDYIMKNWIK